MSKAILDALGVTDEVSALRAIAEFTTFMNGVKDAVGVPTAKLGECVLRVQDVAALARQVTEVTGKPHVEVVGTILAWKSAADALPEAQKEASDAKAEVDKRDRAELLKQGRDERKISPGMVAYWTEADEHGKPKRSTDDLRAFLASAPVLMPTPVKQPSIEGSVPGGDKLYEDMAPMEKHALLEAVGQEQFNAIVEDSRKRVAAKNNH
ncbi:MAG: hypothetical protein AMXMBFR56_76740 [Polyangiaceae bacterium]